MTKNPVNKECNNLSCHKPATRVVKYSNSVLMFVCNYDSHILEIKGKTILEIKEGKKEITAAIRLADQQLKSWFD